MQLSDKAQAIIFILITFAISWTIQYFMIHGQGIMDVSTDMALMWTPGVVGIVLSLAFGHKLKDIGFKIGSISNYLIAYAIPAVTALLILALLIFFGLGSFEIKPSLFEKYGDILSITKNMLLKGILLGGFFGFISGLGEEIGWRGFLHARFLSLNIQHPYLVIGLIWALWHSPLILFSNYATSNIPLLSVLIFTIMTTSMSVYMGWLRQRSGSVFTAALVHGTHNLWIQAIYPSFIKPGPLDPFFGGESGIFNAVIYTAIAIFIYKKYLQLKVQHQL